MGWAVHWVCHGRQTVCDPPSVSPVLSHCTPCMAEYQPSKAAKSTSKGRACSALAVHAGEPNTAPFQFYCVAHLYTCSSTHFNPALSTVIPQLTEWGSHCRQGPLYRDGGTECSTARYAPRSVTTHECTSQSGGSGRAPVFMHGCNAYPTVCVCLCPCPSASLYL